MMTKAQQAAYDLIKSEGAYMDFFTGNFYSCISKKNIRSDVFFKLPVPIVYYKKDDYNTYYKY